MGTGETIPRMERLLNLLALLLRCREPVPAATIREQVTGYKERAAESEESFQRLFRRDREELRRHGVPVERVSPDGSAGGYVIRRDQYYLPHIELDPVETLLLGQLVTTVDPQDQSRFARALRSAVRKLSFDRPEPEDDSAWGLPDAVRAALTLPEQERDLSLVLAAAVGERRTVSFGYHSLERDVRSHRRVDPFGVRFVGGHWYLVGRDHGAGRLRTFRVSRVEPPLEVAGDDEPGFEVPEDFRLEDHVPRGPWGFAGPGPAAVTVRFDDEVWWMVEEAVAGERRVAPASARTLRLGGGNLPALYRYLARFLDHVEVLAPDEARAGFRELALAARARHEEDSR
jgi:proteasome accessory factor B